MTRARISCCIIARDEGAMLADCLASLRGAVDEVVVCDTGSVDDTVAIATSAGAIVVQDPWRNDFARARNTALAAASGDWILVLDADERLAPGAARVLRDTIARDDLDAGLLPLYNATRLDATPAEILDGSACRGDPVLLPRLLRRTPDLAWEGVIHESVTAWVAGRRVRRVSAAILHLGSVPEVVEGRHKRERNIELHRRRCELEPDSPTPRGYLAGELVDLGDEGAAYALVEEAWPMMVRAMTSGGQRPAYVRLATLCGQLRLRAGNAEGALEVVDLALSWGERHPNLYFVRARALDAAAQGSPYARARALRVAAVDAVRRCLEQEGQLFHEVTLYDITGALGWHLLGTLLLALGEPASAAQVAAARLEVDPGREDLSLVLAEAHLDAGDAGRALAEVEPLLSESPDAWVLAALACDALGALDDAASFAREARARWEHPPVAMHRRGRLVDLEAALALYQGRFQLALGPVLVLSALASRVALPPSFDEGAPADPVLVRSVVANLARLGGGDRIEALLEPRGEAMMPGLGAAVRAALASCGVPADEDGEVDVAFVADERLRTRLLAHPRCCLLPAVRDIDAPTDRRRRIGAWPPDEAAANRAWPRARFVGPCPADARHLPMPDGAVDADPDGELRRVLAFLGEPWHDGLAASVREAR